MEFYIWYKYYRINKNEQKRKESMCIKSKLLTIMALLLSTTINAAVITMPVSGTVSTIDDPDNLLFSNLGLIVNVGDSYTAGYTVDDADIANSVSSGVTHNLSDLSFNHFSDFGSGGSVSNDNFGYRITILDNYNNPDVGPLSADVWGISADLGVGGTDGFGTYHHILDIFFLDFDQDKHSNSDLYFNDTLIGWEFSGINITKWYADNDSRNTTLLTSLPSAVPVPAAIWLFGSGLLGLIGVVSIRKNKRGRRD
jgi:hypothetical protein